MSTPTQPTEEQKYASLQRFIAEWKPGTPYQFRSWSATMWRNSDSAAFAGANWPANEYRIPPAPKIEPWDFETAPELTMRVRSKKDGLICRAGLIPNGAWIHFGFNELRVTYAELLADFEQLDGRPCGQEATV